MKIISYRIVTARSDTRLEKLVFENLKLGWIPQGGVAVLRTPIIGSQLLAQAMVLDRKTITPRK